MRVRRLIGATTASLAMIGLLTACEPAPPPTTFVVTSSGSATDASPGDGVCAAAGGSGCTLPAAISEANAGDGAYLVRFADGVGSASLDNTLVTSDLTIEGDPDAIDLARTLLHGRIVHSDGHLVVRDVDFEGGHADSCGGAVESAGDSLVLEGVRAWNVVSGDQPGVAICATGALVIRDSEFELGGVAETIAAHGPVLVERSAVVGLQVHGPGPVAIANSFVLQFDAATASGRVRFSYLEGAPNAAIDAAGSVLDCSVGGAVDSAGYNLDVADACGTDAPTDRTSPTRPVHVLDARELPIGVAWPVGSELVGAIPAGTPGLCDGSHPLDLGRRARPANRACDIGPNQTSIGIGLVAVEARVGADVVDVVDVAAPVVNASGTVAATFAGSDGQPDGVGRWHADDSFEASGLVGTTARDIAADGTVVGSIDSAGVSQPWRWDADGTSHVLTGIPGATGGLVHAIAPDGTVVGESLHDGSWTLWWQAPGGEVVPLPGGGGETRVHAVDDGVAVGERAGTAVQWDLAAGTVTELAGIEGAPWVHWSSVALARRSDGVVYGRIDSDLVTWSADGTAKVIARYLDPTAIATSDDRIVATSAMFGGCTFPTCFQPLWVEHAAGQDLRAQVLNFQATDVSVDGTFVGHRSTATGTEVVRVRYAIDE